MSEDKKDKKPLVPDESKGVKLRNMIISEEDREFSTKIGEDEFTIRIPLPYERTHIIGQIARTFPGVDRKQISNEDYLYAQMLVTLNYVVIDSPDWWKGAGKCPDQDLLVELWTFYNSSETEFQKKLKKNKLPRATGL